MGEGATFDSLPARAKLARLIDRLREEQPEGPGSAATGCLMDDAANYLERVGTRPAVAQSTIDRLRAMTTVWRDPTDGAAVVDPYAHLAEADRPAAFIADLEAVLAAVEFKP